MKYTDLAIYIDANMQYIKNNGEYPHIESNIFEYIYHIVYALSLKAGYFRDFADYDEFSLEGRSYSDSYVVKRTSKREAFR